MLNYEVDMTSIRPERLLGCLVALDAVLKAAYSAAPIADFGKDGTCSVMGTTYKVDYSDAKKPGAVEIVDSKYYRIKNCVKVGS